MISRHHHPPDGMRYVDCSGCATPDVVDDVLGPVRVCADCDEAWPLDAEFYSDPETFVCIACETESVERRRRSMAAASRRYRRRARATARALADGAVDRAVAS